MGSIAGRHAMYWLPTILEMTSELFEEAYADLYTTSQASAWHGPNLLVEEWIRIDDEKAALYL